MREIKFRGQRIDTKEWVCGYLIATYDDRLYIGYLHTSTSLDGDEVIPETVGEFIGLKDKTSVEIYEGDILPSGIITWNDIRLCWSVIEKGYFHQEEDDLLWGDLTNVINPEIIGNIHENPELLK